MQKLHFTPSKYFIRPHEKLMLIRTFEIYFARLCPLRALRFSSLESLDKSLAFTVASVLIRNTFVFISLPWQHGVVDSNRTACWLALGSCSLMLRRTCKHLWELHQSKYGLVRLTVEFKLAVVCHRSNSGTLVLIVKAGWSWAYLPSWYKLRTLASSDEPVHYTGILTKKVTADTCV